MRLTESHIPRYYWHILKSRMIKEGNETVINCDTFKLKKEKKSTARKYRAVKNEGK